MSKINYQYGVEYATNGEKPDLPDDVVIERNFKGEWSGLRDKIYNFENWDNVSSFRILDDRYAPSQLRQAGKLDIERIDVIGQNGNDGLHYGPKTSADYLAECLKVQLERGKQYDASGTGERSFDSAAEAFNCITGKDLRGSDVCLLLQMVKYVRQYSSPDRLHQDSVLDAVSYGALWAEQITGEL